MKSITELGLSLYNVITPDKIHVELSYKTSPWVSYYLTEPLCLYKVNKQGGFAILKVKNIVKGFLITITDSLFYTLGLRTYPIVLNLSEIDIPYIIRNLHKIQASDNLEELKNIEDIKNDFRKSFLIEVVGLKNTNSNYKYITRFCEGSKNILVTYNYVNFYPKYIRGNFKSLCNHVGDYKTKYLKLDPFADFRFYSQYSPKEQTKIDDIFSKLKGYEAVEAL